MAETPHYYYAHGRRKESVATVRVFAGKGEITVAEQPAEQYFNNATLMARLQEPLKLVGQDAKMSATLRLSGGGKTGQADAARLAISRALLEMDAELRPTLKKAGLLTRDSREKERKKYGLKRARKAPQFSKR